MAALVFRSGRSSAAISVASEPVPAVVGMARSGFSGDEIRDLGGVEAGSSADADKPVKAATRGEVGGLLEGLQGRLDMDAVKNLALDTFCLYDFLNLVCYSDPDHPRIRDDHHALGVEPLYLPPGLFRGSGAEGYRRGF